jgi:hypothetical protein
MKRIVFVIVIMAWIAQGSILAYASFYNFSVPFHPLWLQLVAVLSCPIVLISWIGSLFGRHKRKA